ncbi:hypothetical protein EDD17DRAFT_1626653 [Pisolithus thermaeus]|nr:hypothetical protein EDD17DRAFT_1626653 [Pisolithus thermaeus]
MSQGPLRDMLIDFLSVLAATATSRVRQGKLPCTAPASKSHNRADREGPLQGRARFVGLYCTPLTSRTGTCHDTPTFLWQRHPRRTCHCH